MPAEDFLAEKGRKTEAALEAYVQTWRGVPPKLLEVIRYALFGGGKRLRPALVLGAADLVSGDDASALSGACAVEMLHTYSLVHDDLPSMDDDDLRRGRPTTHTVYGEAMAILAGDGLLTMAFDVLSQTDNITVIRELASAGGVVGLVGGQAVDLESEGQTIELDQLRALHAAKTGALIRGAVRIGAMLAGADDGALSALTHYGDCVGLAFQIVDDILDETGDTATLGKSVGKDAKTQKCTYPALVGLEESRRLAREAVEDAKASLDGFGAAGGNLSALADYILVRDS